MKAIVKGHKINVGRHCSEETRKKIGEANRGKIRSKETIEKLVKSHKGRVSTFKGKHHTKEAKKKLRLANLGEKSVFWKGGRYANSKGYIFIYVPYHPNAVNNYVVEHRLMMEDFLERYLTKEEVVHHINKIKSDNRIENLMLFKNDNGHKHYHKLLREKKNDSMYIPIF